MRRAKSIYRAERQYLRSRATASCNGYMLLIAGIVCVCVGLPGIFVGDSASCRFSLVGAMWIAASGWMFHARRRPRQHWLQLLVFRERAKKGAQSKHREHAIEANANDDSEDSP